MTLLKCSACGQYLPPESFAMSRSNPHRDNRYHTCRKCDSARKKVKYEPKERKPVEYEGLALRSQREVARLLDMPQSTVSMDERNAFRKIRAEMARRGMSVGDLIND